MEKKVGKIIVIEGACDGIGKTTQYKMLCDRLREDNIDFVMHHFPSYNTSAGAATESYLRGELGTPSDLSPYFINSLYAVDRGSIWATKLKKEYDEGKIIVLDRYTTSSLIYQSALINNIDDKKEFIDYVCDFEYEKIGIKPPDCVIFLYAPFDIVNDLRLSRQDNEGVINDIHEKDIKYMKKVYDNAVFVSSYLGWDRIECADENRLKSIESIHEKVYKKVKNVIDMG